MKYGFFITIHSFVLNRSFKYKLLTNLASPTEQVGLLFSICIRLSLFRIAIVAKSLQV